MLAVLAAVLFSAATLFFGARAWGNDNAAHLAAFALSLCFAAVLWCGIAF